MQKKVNLLIAAEDCKHHKPDAEPYRKALELLGKIPFKHVIIYEDSVSGVTSAEKVTDHVRIHVATQGDPPHWPSNRYTFQSYSSQSDPYRLTPSNIESPLGKRAKIRSELMRHLPLHEVTYCESNVKSGFICDITRMNMVFKDQSTRTVVLKMSNSGNVLAETAERLNVYGRENYFYEHLARLVNVSVPHCFRVLHMGETKAVLLEDVTERAGQFDVRLSDNFEQLFRAVSDICRMHCCMHFESREDVLDKMRALPTVADITVYRTLITQRYDKFRQKIGIMLQSKTLALVDRIYADFDLVIQRLSRFPLSFCHGDYKAPNMYFRSDGGIVILDWQYIHLGKGVSDIAFLLVESLPFDPRLSQMVLDLSLIHI